jgi:hypothetical protein
MAGVDRVGRPARPRAGVARAGIVIGGLVGLVLTPTFASAYFAAYGINDGESPPGWLDDLAWASWEPSPGAVSDYERLGVAFGLSVLASAVALYVIVGEGCRGGRRERVAWAFVYGGLAVVAVGSLGEYGIGGDGVAVAAGFVMEGLGFLVVAVGAARLGWALRANGSAGLKVSIVVGVGVPVGMVAGLFLVRHTPSGPAALLLVGAVAIGLVGLPATARPRRFGVAD